MTVRADSHQSPHKVVIASIESAILAESVYTIVLRLTLVLVLLHGASSAFIEMPIRILAILLLAFPALLGRKELWWSAAGLLALGNALQWYSIDNHKYLINYWVVACAMSMHQPEPAVYLRVNSRVLVGLVFVAAALWKVFGGEYFDGSFMYLTFLTDARLERLAAAISDQPIEAFRRGTDALRLIGQLGIEQVAVPLVGSATVKSIALIVSMSGLVYESLVALTHVLPTNRLYYLRHILLIGFILITYLLLPVSGFAFMLMVAGLAQCRDESSGLKMGYMFVFAGVQFTRIPWQQLLTLPF